MYVFFLRKKSIFLVALLLSGLLALSTHEIVLPTSMNTIFASSEKVAYLTFDDGPTSSVTPKILDILKEYQIKATFFLLGSNAETHPDLVKRIYEEGHTIGNHGYSHNNAKLYASKEAFLKEIHKTDEIIGTILGIKNYSCHIFRFPNGSTARAYCQEKQEAMKWLEEIGYDYIDWNALNKDSERKYSNQVLMENLKESAKGKGTLVVLMHDTGDVNKTYDILADSINFLLSEGYNFKELTSPEH
ncbi:MAG: polysaccharide deacetylase [Clostridia bacterium]|nr:polysaccharide deacetylase [Clostridia bacterium]